MMEAQPSPLSEMGTTGSVSRRGTHRLLRMSWKEWGRRPLQSPGTSQQPVQGWGERAETRPGQKCVGWVVHPGPRIPPLQVGQLEV